MEVDGGPFKGYINDINEIFGITEFCTCGGSAHLLHPARFLYIVNWKEKIHRQQCLWVRWTHYYMTCFCLLYLINT